MKTDSDLSPVSGPKAAVSNLALVGDEFESALDYVASLGAEGIEIAPTVLWPGWGRSPSAAREAREKVEARGLGVASLQSILYGRSDLNLFGTADVRARLEAHLMDVGELAVELEAPIIVFGSPENRRRDGLGLDEAIDTAASFFRRIGERLSRLGVVLTMEPNPSQYGADFLTDLPSAASFVRLVGSSGIRLQLDTSEIILNGLDPAEEIPPNLDIIGHVQSAVRRHSRVVESSSPEDERAERDWSERRRPQLPSVIRPQVRASDRTVLRIQLDASPIKKRSAIGIRYLRTGGPMRTDDE